jgi:hypothetical protein
MRSRGAVLSWPVLSMATIRIPETGTVIRSSRFGSGLNLSGLFANT